MHKANGRYGLIALISGLIGLVCLAIFWDVGQLNHPHRLQSNEMVRYSSFSEPPKTLDPARSYASNEWLFTAQIYEPVLQYHYLQRPYRLEPLTASVMPKVLYYNRRHQRLPASAPGAQVAYSVYDVRIRSGVFYQPHPAFAKNAKGKAEYLQLSAAQLSNIKSIVDFKQVGTRELTADDYIYQIKRLASPELHSPVYGFMADRIKGLADLHQRLQVAQQKGEWLDLRRFPLAGVKKIGRYRYQIIIKGKYPQFNYWLAMPFFAPIPWEADQLYHQPGLAAHHIGFDWCPVGTGPYYLGMNDLHRQITLLRNPHYHSDYYPETGQQGDRQRGYLDLAGQRLPFIDKVVFVLEKEAMPRWNKFLQGYYDQSGVSSDSFDQAIRLDHQGALDLTAELKAKSMKLTTNISPSIYFFGFNMLDPVVGGNSDRTRKLRQAISIALNYEEYISIFLNGRGLVAQGPVPPGIYGHQQGKGYNHYTHQRVNGFVQRRPLSQARELMTAAGYPGGLNRKTGKRLQLNYDVAGGAGPDQKAQLAWMREKFSTIGIDLNVHSSQYNRFQQKVRLGNTQMFSWGWLADYPDPENFLFLLYGPNGKVKGGGENSVNYNNPKFNTLFEQMRHLPNGPKRLAVIKKMVEIVQVDAPWVWGVHPKDIILTHQWQKPVKPSGMANNLLKYQFVNHQHRVGLQQKWNRPLLWPLLLMFAGLLILLIPAFWQYWIMQAHNPTKRFGKKHD